MNLLNEPIFLNLIADWMAKEFPTLIHIPGAAWWLLTDHGPIVCWVDATTVTVATNLSGGAFLPLPQRQHMKELSVSDPEFFEKLKRQIECVLETDNVRLK